MRSSRAIGLALAVGVGLLGPGAAAGLRVGEIADDWTAQNWDGSMINLYDYSGDIIVADWVGIW